MRKLTEFKHLLAPLAALKRLLDKSGCQWMIIGGVAASLLGKPRLTADVDAVALIEDKELPDLLKAAKSIGFKTRISDAMEFAQKTGFYCLNTLKQASMWIYH